MSFHFLDGVVNKVEGAAKDVGHATSVVAKGNSDPGGGVFGFLRNQLLPGDQQLQAKVQEAKSAPGNVAHEFVTRPAARIGISAESKVAEAFGKPQTPYLVPQNIPGGTKIFGSEPIQSYQQQYSGNRDTHGAPFSFLATGTTAAMDALSAVPAGTGVLKAGKAVNETKNAIIAPRIALKDQQVLRDYNDYLTGANPANGKGELTKLISDARAVGQKHGVDLSANATRESRITATADLLDSVGKNRSEVGAVGRDVLGDGKKPEAANIADKLVSAKTPQDAFKTLTQGGVDGVTARRIAPAVVHTKDPNIINNIIDRAHQPPPTPADIIAARTPPEIPTGPAGQGAPAVKNILTEMEQNAMKQTEFQREALDKTYSQQRAERAAKATSASQDLTGIEKHRAELSRLKGDYAKPGYTGLSNHYTLEEQNARFKELSDVVNKDPELSQPGKFYDRLSTNEALQKFIYGDERPLQPGEITKLKNVFGEQFGNAVQKTVDDHIQGKTTVGDKFFALWRGGLLTGARTLNKVIVSHAVHGSAELIKDAPATLVDKFASLISGQRSMALTLKGSAKGASEAAHNLPNYLKTGEGIGGGTDFHTTAVFGNSVPGKIANLYATGPGRLHGAIYNLAGRSAEVHQLYSEALAEAKNAGLKGDAKQTFVEKYVSQPSPEALGRARDAGDRAAFRQKTLLSDLVSRLQHTDSPAWNMVAKVLAPFQRIPSAIGITGLIDYTPAGAMKTIVKGIQDARSEEGWTLAAQQQFSKGLGRSITGTAAFMPGIMLFNKGMLSLDYPKDKATQKLWQEEGRQAWSVKIGGHWLSLGTLGPIGIVLGIGGGIGQGLSEGQNIPQAFGTGMFKGVLTLQEETYLSGVNAVVSAVQEGGNKVTALEKQYAGSIVPTFVRNWASATDTKQRQADNAWQNIVAGIPGQRESLPAKRGAFGESVPSGGGYNAGGLREFLDPFYSTKANTSDPVVAEMRRLNDVGFPATPTQIDAKENFNGVNYNLPRKQRDLLQAVIGYNEKQAWEQTINSPSYQNLSDDQKQKQLRDISSNISHELRGVFAQQYHYGIYSPTYQQDKKAPKK